jgi:hypothetical protein
MKNISWPVLVIPAVFLSQLLVLTAWDAAKFVTIFNVVCLLVAISGLARQRFERRFEKDVRLAMEASVQAKEIIAEKDLGGLPSPVQTYLRYAGVVGKPKIKNFKICFEGQMREKGKDWFNFTSRQYNFVDQPARHFFMKARINGLPVHGYHSYKIKDARMQIRLLGLFPIVNLDGPEMFPTETVTFFNDLCLFAPAALLDTRITWEAVNELSARATFTNRGTSISAMLYFNDKGQLINFISNDRYSVAHMKTYPFSTPVADYKYINGYHLCSYGEAVWHYPAGDFVYGKFKVKEVLYNVTMN